MCSRHGGRRDLPPHDDTNALSPGRKQFKEAVMSNYIRMMDLLRDNEITARKFHDVESRILSVLNYEDFFEVLLSEIMVRFNLPFVWISLIQGSEVSELMEQSLGSSQLLREKSNLIERKAFEALVGTTTTPILMNDDLLPCRRLFPENREYLIKSLALVPITWNGEIIGSLNLGDSSDQRFKPGIDTSLLARLALKVSLCLSNVTAHEKLRFLAFHDPLTELLNRRVMEKILEREFKRAGRYDSELSLVFIDLDHFKQMNDTYGHDEGDRLLKHFAEIMRGMIRSSDVVSRYAGDEFVIILPQTDIVKAEQFMERISTAFSESPLEIEGTKISVGFSYGAVSTHSGEFETHGELLKRADHLLYEKKKARKEAPLKLAVQG